MSTDKIFLFQSAENVQLATNAPLLHSYQFLVNQENTRNFLDNQIANHAQLDRLARIVTPYLTYVHLDSHRLLVPHRASLSQLLLAILHQALTNVLGPTQEPVCFVRKALSALARTPRHANVFQAITA